MQGPTTCDQRFEACSLPTRPVLLCTYTVCEHPDWFLCVPVNVYAHFRTVPFTPPFLRSCRDVTAPRAERSTRRVAVG